MKWTYESAWPHPGLLKTLKRCEVFLSQNFVFLSIHCARVSEWCLSSKTELLKKSTQQLSRALESVFETVSVYFESLRFKKSSYQSRLWKLCLSCSPVVWLTACALTADAARNDVANFIFTWDNIWKIYEKICLFFQWEFLTSLPELCLFEWPRNWFNLYFHEALQWIIKSFDNQ